MRHSAKIFLLLVVSNRPKYWTVSNSTTFEPSRWCLCEGWVGTVNSKLSGYGSGPASKQARRSCVITVLSMARLSEKSALNADAAMFIN